ncbi:MAG: hypothetical protein Fur005_29550 [Roseiflexaceae bacterium]
MPFKQTMFRLTRDLLIENLAKGTTAEQLSQRLQSEGATLTEQFGKAADTIANRKQIGHIIGIERWGQSRIRTLLGSPLRIDEYDSYRPDAAADMAIIRAEWAHTRAATLELIDQLSSAGIDFGTTVEHNDFGPMSVRGWLTYLNTHATLEAKRIRP